MIKRCLLFFTLFAIFILQAQEQLLPPDFRQHNLTEYNSSFLSPVFALDRNNPQSVALWTRWQWQSIDADPTTLFLNYTRRLNTESVAGIGFFQNNTGVFLQSGGVLNYAYALDLESNAQIAFGLNLFGFVRKLAENFQPDPNISLPIFAETNDFILRLDPSLRFKLNRFSIGIVAENLFDYNFTAKEKDTGPMEKVYIGLASYSFPITIFGSSENSYIQPTVYMKTLPTYDNQFGFTTLFSTPKFWVQAGYNNFYGISGGAGARLFSRFSIGALMEFGSSNALQGTDPTFEFVTSYRLGSPESKGQIMTPEEEEEEEKPLITEAEQMENALAGEEAKPDKKEERLLEREAKLAEKQQRKDAVAAAKEQQKLTLLSEKAAEKTRDSIIREQKRLNLIEGEKIAQQRQDSITEVRNREEQLEARRIADQQQQDALALAQRQDSIVRVQKENEMTAKRIAEQKTLDSLAGVRRQQRIAEAGRMAEQRRQDSIIEVQKETELAAKRIAEQKTRDSLADVRKQQRIAEAARIAEQRRQDSIIEVQKEKELAAKRIAEQKTRDSLADVRKQQRIAEAARISEQRRQDSIIEVQKEKELAAKRIAEQKTRDSLAEVRKQQRITEAARIEEQKRQDAIEAVKKAEALAVAKRKAEEKKRDSLARIRAQERMAIAQAEEQKRIQDSITQVKAAEAQVPEQQQAVKEQVVAVEPQAGEKYEEAVTEDGLEPGFYLIANVFGTKKYFETFMTTLKDQGLRPRSFFRSLNKYNYVYLQRYDSMTEARKARDTKFNGRYQGNTWIFRVVGQ